MTLRKIALFAVAIPLFAGFFACNSSYEPTGMTASSAAVRSFSLTKDDSVLANLDSVYFSIDLTKGLIFNADSMPVGTNVTRLIPIITTLETPSVVELRVKRSNGTDTTYNYLTNSTDSIDFSNPVNLRIVSYDGLNEYNYTITVNVHKMVSDSLRWLEEKTTVLPSALEKPTSQRTVKSGDTFFCLTSDGENYSMAKFAYTTTPVNGPLLSPDKWTTSTIVFPFTPEISSLSANDSELFILSEDGTLYKSENEGQNWTSCGLTWHYIYGKYDSRILGSVETADGWMIQSYPDGSLLPLPDEMPVEATSVPVSYLFPMSASTQMVIVGGRMADGRLTSATWSYDGASWVRLSIRPLPTALENVAVCSYFSFSTSSSWNVTTYPTLIAFGGKGQDGNVSSTVYTSTDYGVNWKKASDLMQLPAFMPALYDAQVYVADSYYSTSVKPMIVKPTETWACPYIYMFGGYDRNNDFQNTLWSGLINRLSFAPIE